jgi:hypothetical protein
MTKSERGVEPKRLFQVGKIPPSARLDLSKQLKELERILDWDPKQKRPEWPEK